MINVNKIAKKVANEPLEDELRNWIIGETEDGHMPLVKKEKKQTEEEMYMPTSEEDELDNWIVGETEDGHMPLVRKPQHVIDEDRGDEIRQMRKEQAQREMYDDPVMNWSGLR